MRTMAKRPLSPRERVLTAISRQEPDRVPIDYLSNPGIDARLKDHFHLARGDDEGLREALRVDFRGISVPYIGPRLHAEVPGRHVAPDWGIRTRWVEHEHGGYWDYCDFPLEDADEQTVADWPMPSPDQYDYGAVRDLCRKFDRYAITIGDAGYADIINSNGFLRGTEQSLIDLATDDPAGLRLMDRRHEVQLGILERILEAAQGRIDLLYIGEDLGSQSSPLISKELFRRHIRPRHEKFVSLAKSYGLPVMIHSCGSSSWAFEDFIEMGIDVVDTLQPEARDMSPAYLKERFGGRLAFHGCISTAGPVTYGSVPEVAASVKETLEIMMPGGGYCLSPTHQLQDNSPTENVVALYETAWEHGLY